MSPESQNMLDLADKSFKTTHDLVFGALRREILAVLNSPENKHITKFVMAMGSAFFCAKTWHKEEIFLNDEDTTVEKLDENEDIVLDHDYADLIAPVFKIISDWNSHLYLTGYPIRYDRDHVTGEWIETNDW